MYVWVEVVKSLCCVGNFTNSSSMEQNSSNLQINFLDGDAGPDPRKYDLDRVTNMPCLICDKEFALKKELDDYLGHLFMAHRVVIADVQDIAMIEEYLDYWRSKLSDETLPKYCTTMLLNQKPDGTVSQDEKYYLLSDVISEDLTLRQDLDKRMLKLVVDHHQFELTDKKFSRGCIFCRDIGGPMRSDFIDHLYNKHFLLLGKAEKLVFVDHLFDRIERQMEQLICLYCEKLFTNRTALKEHMRKKGHKKINPANKSYDQYFLIHYYKERKSTNMKRKPRASKKPEEDLLTDDFAGQDSDSDWSDWKEDGQNITCLFCPEKQEKFSNLKNHLMESHSFNLEESLKDRSFYERIKIINFIRRQMLNRRCISCEKKHEDTASLQDHLRLENHCQVPSIDRWNLPEFFFPTFEDDALLYFIEEDTNLEHNDSVQIFSEDSTVQINKDAENLSRESFQLNE